jgi:hypothetical protein
MFVEIKFLFIEEGGERKVTSSSSIVTTEFLQTRIASLPWTEHHMLTVHYRTQKI